MAGVYGGYWVSYSVSVFVSHSWANSGHYDTLANWIFVERWKVNGTPIFFINTSVPRDNPIHNAKNTEQLRAQIYAKIASSHVVVCPTGMYSTHSTWISRELGGAQLYGRPVVGVNPWAQKRKSVFVQEKATVTVGWTKQSVINAIWNNRRR